MYIYIYTRTIFLIHSPFFSALFQLGTLRMLPLRMLPGYALWGRQAAVRMLIPWFWPWDLEFDFHWPCQIDPGYVRVVCKSGHFPSRPFNMSRACGSWEDILFADVFPYLYMFLARCCRNELEEKERQLELKDPCFSADIWSPDSNAHHGSIVLCWGWRLLARTHIFNSYSLSWISLDLKNCFVNNISSQKT